MNLLCNMLRERNGWHFNRLDVCKVEQLGPSYEFRSENLRIAKRDINIDVVERTPCQFACNVIADSRGVVQIVKTSRFFDHKHEVVVEVSELSLDEVSGRRLLIILAAEIDVLGGSRSVAKPLVEGQCPL